MGKSRSVSSPTVVKIFQILHRDGMGRIGKLSVPHGEVTTPTLMPVIDPSNIVLTPREMRQEFGVEIVITNAYLILRRYGGKAAKRGIHRILRYDGPIMTDSGGYQILRYGTIDVGPEEIVRYQDAIAPDIATILDVPTGIGVNKERAAETVRVTLERARQAIELRSNPKVAWCGPVQGGTFFDLVAECAREIGKLDYQLHAIGSPVELLEDYRYAEIVDLVMTAKQNLPLERPTHLFGAGHPMMLPLAVAMGCDLFDSAAYVQYARDNRYITPDKTLKLDDLAYLPCECPTCSEYTLNEIKRASPEERIRLLAKHNLSVIFGELRRIRQAIIEGRLLEYVEMKCRAHPRLLNALRRLAVYRDFIERFDPVTKPSAFFYLGPESADRPEVVRYARRFAERYEPPVLPILALVPMFEKGRPRLEDPDRTHLVRLIPPFGVVPEELEDIYPLGQFQVPEELDERQKQTVVDSLSSYLQKFGHRYEKIILFDDPSRWGTALVDVCGIVREKLTVIALTG
ncbi:MAG: tRNA guanosine(15) transglycosylase TgtA [Hadesarchaea archaeon]|nr:tRNA guanosine(15) transglycosylase TgtA [Hadesarchaea archaeon]